MYHRRRRSIRRNRRGSSGKGMTHGIIHSLTSRPLKWVSGALGFAAVATVFTTPDSSGYSAVTDVIAAVKDKNYGAIAGIPSHIINGALSGQWIAPALGAAFTGIISRKFKI